MNKNKKINNGIICVSPNFTYSCPLKIDDDYKNIILSLFYNDFNMQFKNMIKANTLKKIIPSIQDEISAGKLGSYYGYTILEFKKNNANIFLPEFFNKYQLIKTLNEIVVRENYNYSIYNEINGYNNDLIDSSAYTAYNYIKKLYSDIYYDALNNFEGYTEDRKIKAKKIIKQN